MAVSIPRVSRRSLARFFRRVVVDESGCWLWQGPRNSKGYGFAFGTSAHRTSYEWFVAPVIPDMHKSGFVIDHLCRVRHCVNPAHLDQVTVGENNRRAIPYRLTCKNGHPKSVGTHGFGNNRTCALCHKIRQIAYIDRIAVRKVAA